MARPRGAGIQHVGTMPTRHRCSTEAATSPEQQNTSTVLTQYSLKCLRCADLAVVLPGLRGPAKPSLLDFRKFQKPTNIPECPSLGRFRPGRPFLTLGEVGGLIKSRGYIWPSLSLLFDIQLCSDGMLRMLCTHLQLAPDPHQAGKRTSDRCNACACCIESATEGSVSGVRTAPHSTEAPAPPLATTMP